MDGGGDLLGSHFRSLWKAGTIADKATASVIHPIDTLPTAGITPHATGAGRIFGTQLINSHSIDGGLSLMKTYSKQILQDLNLPLTLNLIVGNLGSGHFPKY